MCWVACKGKACFVVGGVIALGCVRSQRQWIRGVITIMGRRSGVSLYEIGWTLLIKGMPPGVLFQVNLW